MPKEILDSNKSSPKKNIENKKSSNDELENQAKNLADFFNGKVLDIEI